MVVQSYKGNRLSILYLNRFGRLAHLRRAYRRGCRSKAAFVPLREAQAMSPELAVCFISLCGAGRAEMSVCVYRRLKSAVRRIDSRALPLICAHRTIYCRPSRNRGVEGCAAAAGLSASAESKTQAYAARAPARRPAGRQCAGLCAKAECIGACFFTRRHKGVSPAPPHMECRYARGVPEKQACADAACAYVREDAASTAAVLLGKVRLRSRSVRADSARALCAFRRDVSETPRQKAAKRFSLQTKKASAARSRRRLSFTRFSSRRGRTEG